MFDNLAKTIKIPIIINKGEVKFLYGGEMPEIDEGTVGDLILPEYSIKNKDMVKKLQENYIVELMGASAKLLLSVYDKFLPTDKKNLVLNITNAYPPLDQKFIEVFLEEPLRLQFRGSKQATLLDVKCKIPTLNNKEATSINNAYMLMSQELEPSRRSHSGNMFDKCYYKFHDNINDCDYWLPLRKLREKYEIEYERDLLLDSQVFMLNNCFSGQVSFFDSEDEILLIDKINEYGDISGTKIKELFEFDRNRYLVVIEKLLEKKYTCKKSL